MHVLVLDRIHTSSWEKDEPLRFVPMLVNTLVLFNRPGVCVKNDDLSSDRESQVDS